MVAILFAPLCVVTVHVTSVERYRGLLQVTYFCLSGSALPCSSILQALCSPLKQNHMNDRDHDYFNISS
jgi:hypothetical protein